MTADRAEKPLNQEVKNLKKEYDSLMSHAWVLASSTRISLDEQHWIADAIIPWASSAMKTLEKDSATKKLEEAIAKRIAMNESVAKTFKGFRRQEANAAIAELYWVQKILRGLELVE